MAQLVKNITSIRYFLDKHNIVDNSYDINMNYHPKVPSKYTSNPTFVAEFNNCSVNSLPVLITEDRHMITEHLWPILDRYKKKPNKHFINLKKVKKSKNFLILKKKQKIYYTLI